MIIVLTSCIISRIQKLDDNSVDPDEAAHNELLHQDLRCLHIRRFSSLVLKVLKIYSIFLVI